ncbi:HAMP domain-containing sensor histidine kinase [Geobacillus proteiniphilus]|uniref:histidine kinase n=3 Tax=Geobacillus proteiniphilus TaxID=860353 RepID=A0ABY9MAW3_9BACL|nr:HAMP domain-containing sensor histidine kinase [Geobacillus proteiniphilus]WMJ15155.1 HAMP domain-containing sensor histidine kinase [Geobacillus proteiniphilus]
MNDKMFKQTRFRLTLLFASLIVVFFVLFTSASYMIVSSLIMTKQRQQAIDLAEEEYMEHKFELLNWYYKNADDDDTDESISAHHSSMPFFYYVITRDGEVIKGEESFPEIRENILHRIHGWRPGNKDVRYETVTIGNEKIWFLLSGKQVLIKKIYIGTIYTGINITEQVYIVKVLTGVLCVMSIVFIGLSVVLGYYMSGRAMVPIANAFKRQKEFVADASHELRTPLSILQSSIEVIESEEKGKLGEFSLQVLDDMKDELKRMTKLTNDLLWLARSDSNAITLTKEWFPLFPVVNELIRKCRPLAEQKQIRFTVHMQEDIMVYGDKERIIQLMFILLDNSVKYNNENGQVSIKVERNRKNVMIEIKDTGIGIPIEHQKYIFERFYRVDPSRSQRQQGYGIGLSIAKWIVDAHGGTINVQSEEKRGSRFIVTLPQPTIIESEG